MTIKARVHNRTIVLPESVEIADGAEVQVIVPEKTASNNSAPTKTLTGCETHSEKRRAE